MLEIANETMDEKIFETLFLAGLLVATIIRSYFGIQTKIKQFSLAQKDHLIVYIGIALWSIVLMLPLITIFSSWLTMADYKIPVPLSTIGSVIFICSIWLLWRSHVDLAKNFSPWLYIRNNHALVTSGVYKRIRHPMYLSFWLWALGQALLIPNWIAGPFGLIAFYLIYVFRIEREEQQLIDCFGDEYREYQRKTGRLFPKGL